MKDGQQVPQVLSVGRSRTVGSWVRRPGQARAPCVLLFWTPGQGHQLAVPGPAVAEMTSGCAGAGTGQAAC